jgi:hypothetical protein
MKLTKQTLQKIIKEELVNVLREQAPTRKAVVAPSEYSSGNSRLSKDKSIWSQLFEPKSETVDSLSIDDKVKLYKQYFSGSEMSPEDYRKWLLSKQPSVKSAKLGPKWGDLQAAADAKR